MTTPEHIFAHAALQAAGWALVHFLWQGALVAVLYAGFCALWKGAGVRYAAACAALALMLALPVLTAAGLAWRAGVATPALTASASEDAWAESSQARGLAASQDGKSLALKGARAEGRDAAQASANLREWAEERFTPFVPWLVFAWLVGVVATTSRFVGGWLVVRRLRRSARPVAAHFEELLTRLSRRLRVSRAVRLCQSALVEVPTVVGHLRPVILIPAGALLGLAPQQLEAVLAHELAHVRRHDYLVNLLQTAAETLLFYHPAVWWVSRRARAEREHACDDAAVAATGDVLTYARALTELERLRRQPAPALALAANGGSLMVRIQRLVKPDARARSRSPLAAFAALAVLSCGVLVCARALVPVGALDSPDAAAAANFPAAQRREVAVTFVAFPGNNIYDDGRLQNKTRKLMRGLAAHNIKAVAFVNEGRLYKEGGALDEVRIRMLREWLDAGHELGNETFAHTNLYDVQLAEFQADVERGEKITGELVRERGGRLRYFSYPYLNTGATPAIKAAAEQYLRGRGYEIHPVTIDNMDWLFNRAYIEALRREDEAGAARIRAEYVPYMERMFEFYESYAREVTGRDIPQVLMLTAGALNADAFEDLVAMMKRRGYSFVTMEQAMKDEAYRLPDTYTGARGDSWVARWAVSKGMRYKDTEEVNLPEGMQQYFKEFLRMRAEKKRAEAGKK